MSTTKIELRIYRDDHGRGHRSVDDTITLDATATLPDGQQGKARLTCQHRPGVYYTPEDISDAVLDAMRNAAGTLR